MNILVLGGTRFLGKTLVEQLQSAGHAVTRDAGDEARRAAELSIARAQGTG